VRLSILARDTIHATWVEKVFFTPKDFREGALYSLRD
jgi:hypothetical protein